MSDFGRALKKMFATAPGGVGEDPDWLELVSPVMLAHEARSQCTDAGRVSTGRPFPVWLRGAALWREHARRDGSADSLTRAIRASESAAMAARNLDECERAMIDRALGLVLAFDLQGGLTRLTEADHILPKDDLNRPPAIAAALIAVRARVRTRQARLAGHPEGLVAAAALMDAAVRAVEACRAPGAEELRLERAALALETGIQRRDAALLDQAGRELRRLVADADPDRRPLARARALTLCAAGLAGLAALAGDDGARVQANLLFESAADQFTADHSPMDWVAIQLARAAAPRAASLAGLRQSERLTAGRGLVLGALARDRRMAFETASAEAIGNVERLQALRAEILARLTTASPDADLDWATDQIALARLSAARPSSTRRKPDADVVLGLFEAAEVARERGVPALAEAAEALMPVRTTPL